MEARTFQLFTRSVRPRRCLQCVQEQARWRSKAQPRRNYASKGTEEKWKQAFPIGGYYEALLSQPPSKVSPAVSSSPPPVPAPAPATSDARKAQREETAAKARIVFGSRLAGPAERRAELQAKSTLEGGVWVPPRPEEPDNCCMSGCVNCVWDRYGEEVEEWAARRKEADAALAREREARAGGAGAAVSMDDDGGGSETNWGTGLDSDLFRDVPVGIREFMKQEKKLKEKHLREGTKGG